MDKAVLKKFATESRRELMEKIKSKINMFYIDEDFNKEQKGDIYILTNEKHTLRLTHEDYKKRELLIKRIKELSLEQVIEEAAYTWFNRIIAIRYMEIHDYLPLTKDNQSLGIRVLSSKDNTPDPEILKFTNLMNPELDIDFKKGKYAELKDDNEKFKYVLLLVCKKLGRVIPQVFNGVTDYIDILIPDNLLNDTGFVTKVINEVPEENYSNVEIIGWLYQYYNQSEKDRVMAQNRAYKKEEIPYVTQLFTPDWIVKYMVENSLGRYWIERNKNTDLIKNWKFFLDSNVENIQEKISPTDITFIDPCCGSGHILVYAFEVLFQIYQSVGYSKNDIPSLILENNLYGLDTDDRAGQLSVLSILLKAREYDKNIFNKKIIYKLNIMSIQESNNINNIDNLKIDEHEKEKVNKLIKLFDDAKNIGSLLLLEEEDYSKIEKALNEDDTIFGIELRNKLQPIIKIATLLNKKYNIVVTNPPYLTNKNMNKRLQTFVNKYYESSKRDLFSCFIKQCCNLTKKNGIYAMITIHTWMFLSAFKKIRNEVVINNKIISMVHLGAGVFKEINTFNVLAASFVIQKIPIEDYESTYIRLVDYANEYEKIREFFNKSNYYFCNQKNLRNIQDNMFLYYLSKNMLHILNSVDNIGNLYRIKPGMTTSNNAIFVRSWYEVDFSKIGFEMKNREIAKKSEKKWFPYNNGGNYRKWYGNNEAIVDWKNDGEDIKNFKLKKQKKNSGFNVGIAALNDIFKKGLTYSIFGFRNFGIRYKDYGFLFDVSGASIFPDDKNMFYLLGFLASKVSFAFLSAIAPTVNFQAGDISSIPYIYNEKYKQEIDEIVQENFELSKKDWDSFETSWDFKKHPLIIGYNKECPYVMKKIKDKDTGIVLTKVSGMLELSYAKWKRQCDDNFKKLKQNEEELNKIFIDIYGLQDELTPEEEDKDVTIRKADQEREIKSLISYAVGCMFGRYSLEKDGLIYAGGDFDKVYKKNKGEDDGWAGASLANYKVLNDNEKEIDLSFEVDNDNVIPITDEAYFEDDIVERFKKFICVVYGKETLNENLDFIAETLGKKGTETSEDTIRRYFVNDFFNDHVKTYKKRPIYWLFDSGKKNGFKALIYMHRYNENLVPKIRLDYLHRMQTTYEKLLSDINYKLTTELSMTDKKETQKRQADLNAKLQEIKGYDEKIAHIANQRISIDLDDGVKVNYDKFKSILAKLK